MSAALRYGALRGLALSAVLFAFPLAWRLGTWIGSGHALWPGEVWMDPQ